MNIDVLKFGGSSLSNNINLNIVANKIIKIQKKNKSKIVVIVSAQGKTTDNLIKEAKELAANPNKRELDALLSTGEQTSAAKLAILLNRMGYLSISLNSFQIGIYTTEEHTNAKILKINKERILKELNKNKIVIITGFQGINKNEDVTTLGRGGSDTSAVAIASILKAKNCYISSDVDGIYNCDPNTNENALKLKNISYDEMECTAYEGAKVLHSRSVALARKYNMKIKAISTFKDNEGTEISNKIEETGIKTIVKNDKMLLVEIKNYNFPLKIMSDVNFEEIKINNSEIKLIIRDYEYEKLLNLIKTYNYNIDTIKISKICFIGYELASNNELVKKLLKKYETPELISVSTNSLMIKIYKTNQKHS